MARFHLLTPIAIVLGPMVGIPVALAMAAGFGILALGWLAPPLANLLGWVCDVNLSFVEHSVVLARDWRGGHAWVAGPSGWWLAGFYALLALFVLAPSFAPPRRWCIALLAAWTTVGFAGSWLASPNTEELACTFLSVGHGTAVVLELPGGQT